MSFQWTLQGFSVDFNKSLVEYSISLINKFSFCMEFEWILKAALYNSFKKSTLLMSSNFSGPDRLILCAGDVV